MKHNITFRISLLLAPLAALRARIQQSQTSNSHPILMFQPTAA
ncbi:MAG: hypothetical protein NTW87_11185 [Planctomycetota bacterium]|nr:hypothetical protein [Planctomycetota bacterium]